MVKNWSFPVVQLVKNLSAMQETWVWFLGWEDPLEKEMANHCSIIAWRIPRTKEPGGGYSSWAHKSQTWLSDKTATSWSYRKLQLLEWYGCTLIWWDRVNPSEVRARRRSAPGPSAQIFKYYQGLRVEHWQVSCTDCTLDTDLKLFIHKSSGDLGKRIFWLLSWSGVGPVDWKKMHNLHVKYYHLFSGQNQGLKPGMQSLR